MKSCKKLRSTLTTQPAMPPASPLRSTVHTNSDLNLLAINTRRRSMIAYHNPNYSGHSSLAVCSAPKIQPRVSLPPTVTPFPQSLLLSLSQLHLPTWCHILRVFLSVLILVLAVSPVQLQVGVVYRMPLLSPDERKSFQPRL